MQKNLSFFIQSDIIFSNFLPKSKIIRKYIVYETDL